MLDVTETERCYVGFAAGGTLRVFFFDGASLEPVTTEPLRGRGTGVSLAMQQSRTSVRILMDYLARSENLGDAETLAAAFADQFLRPLRVDEIVFIEEFRIEDWLRVMRMLGETI